MTSIYDTLYRLRRDCERTLERAKRGPDALDQRFLADLPTIVVETRYGSIRVKFLAYDHAQIVDSSVTIYRVAYELMLALKYDGAGWVDCGRLRPLGRVATPDPAYPHRSKVSFWDVSSAAEAAARTKVVPEISSALCAPERAAIVAAARAEAQHRFVCSQRDAIKGHVNDILGLAGKLSEAVLTLDATLDGLESSLVTLPKAS